MSGYSTRTETLRVAGVEYQLRMLSDRQQFDDADGAAARAGVSPAGWSHFGHVWPSGLGLAQVVATRNCAGLRVLEIGCGLALTSLMLARRGVDITASDHHPLAPTFLAENARINAIRQPTYVDLPWAVECPALGHFDLIVGGDVLYERGHCALVAGVIARHSSPVCRVIITDPGRGQTGRLSRALAAQGFLLETGGDSDSEADPLPERVRLLEFAR